MAPPVRRDAGPTAPGEGFNVSCARDRHRRLRPGIPLFRDLRGSGRLAPRA
jgi:hypothetical protein